MLAGKRSRPADEPAAEEEPAAEAAEEDEPEAAADGDGDGDGEDPEDGGLWVGDVYIPAEDLAARDTIAYIQIIL